VKRESGEFSPNSIPDFIVYHEFSQYVTSLPDLAYEVFLTDTIGVENIDLGAFYNLLSDFKLIVDEKMNSTQDVDIFCDRYQGLPDAQINLAQFTGDYNEITDSKERDLNGYVNRNFGLLLDGNNQRKVEKWINEVIRPSFTKNTFEFSKLVSERGPGLASDVICATN
jgi:hypothetical protein